MHKSSMLDLHNLVDTSRTTCRRIDSDRCMCIGGKFLKLQLLVDCRSRSYTQVGDLATQRNSSHISRIVDQRTLGDIGTLRDCYIGRKRVATDIHTAAVGW